MNTTVDDEDYDDRIFDDDFTKNEKLQSQLRKWAVQHNITHIALKDLMQIFNERLSVSSASLLPLPNDPRTLLSTPPTVSLVPLADGGEYWHHGVENCIKKLLPSLSAPTTIHLTINIDGLPVFNSSKVEFWPILFNIAEMPKVVPMVAGVYCGKAKTNDIDSFLSPFVDEMKTIMENGILINSQKITVKLRCFVCDSPARAFVKGKN